MKKHLIIKNLKKLTLSLIFISISFFTYAKPVDNIKQFSLENGMDVFLLEDPSDAIVHIEYVCRAGFSSQSQENCGFFKLYTKLMKSNNPSLNFSDIQCNADSSVYTLDVTAPETEETLHKLSEAVFSPQYSDDIISFELTKLQNEVKDASEDMAKYINSAIDSKIFSDAPWKNDSGIYPPVFKQTTPAQARVHIKNISDNWYIPQNSALFICGNINPEKLELTIKNTFGKYYSSNKVPEKTPIFINNSNAKEKKFVLHSPDLSPDLTQVAVQYTTLNMDNSDLLASILNNNDSAFKDKLLSFTSLNIPGDEYINVSSVHQRNSSRLIIQTLIQPPEEKENKTTDKDNNSKQPAHKKQQAGTPSSSVTQTIEFCQQLLKIPELIPQEEFQSAKNALIKEIDTNTNNSLNTIKTLADFWAIVPYYQTSESDFSKYPDSITAGIMMNRKNKIANIKYQNLISSVKSEKPFVFVIINTDDYNNHKEEYTKAGYIEITPENSSWYVQKMYKEMREQLAIEEKIPYLSNNSGGRIINTKDNLYYERNVAKIKETKLKNGIKVITKANPDTTGVSLLISIKGGKLNSANYNGFEDVMISIITEIIEDEIKAKQKKGLIHSEVSLSSETNISTSYILIEFNKEDTRQICEAIKKCIIYGDIPPSIADKAVSQKQYKKRLSNGSVKNQMYSEVINQLYGQGDLYKIFDSKNEILTDIEFTSILSEYHNLLDAKRYSVIISGDFDKNIIKYLESSLGILSSNKNISKTEENNEDEIAKFPVNTVVKVPVRHTFLTDISAEEAGPQPAELIPTTEFLDPVIYIIEAPKFNTKESSIFKATLKYIEGELKKEVSRNSELQQCKVTVELPENKTNFAAIIFYNVKHTLEVDAIYKNTINTIMDYLSIYSKKDKTIQNIKNYWTLEELKNTTSNTGTAKLIYQGFEQFPDSPQPAYYLEQYNHIQTASIRDFEKVINYLIKPVNLKVYSESSKK